MRQIINNIIEWQIFFIPFTILIISQFVKIFLERKSEGLQWKNFNSYGGMPSSHTAMLVSLLFMVGFIEGFSSTIFIVTGFIAAIFIRDAMGIRWSLGFHGKMINRIIRELSDEERKHFPFKLNERLGHTPREVAAGALVGLILTLLLRTAILLLA